MTDRTAYLLTEKGLQAVAGHLTERQVVAAQEALRQMDRGAGYLCIYAGPYCTGRANGNGYCPACALTHPHAAEAFMQDRKAQR